MPLPPETISKKAGLYAKVALPLPVATHFTYEVPEDLKTRVRVGSRVEVPFGRRVLSGVVVELITTTDVERTKPISKVLVAHLPRELLALTEWMATYYGCTVGEAAQAALPAVLRRADVRGRRIRGSLRLRLEGDTLEAVENRLQRAPRQLELVRRIAGAGDSAGVEVAEVVSKWGFSTALINALVDKGFIEIDDTRAPSPLETIETPVVRLNVDQETALRSITQAVAGGRFEPILLHGVTGSGKTELYLRSAGRALDDGGGCIILVPEIGLIPQAVARYQRVFGDRLAIIHSRLAGAERFDVWSRVESGECRVVLGPRSAIFSPVRDLRLIIVDEEQDDSYKQDDKPRYHARNVALMRGKQENLTVLLGSATPSAETLHHALTGRYTHLSLPKRAGGGKLPRVHLVDLREQSIEGAFCSSFLVERLRENIEDGNQSILFLNKRGHARFVQCNACGWVARCKNCDIALIYHRVSNRLRCHYCGYHRRQVTRCDECSSPKLYFAGAGTQRVELDLAALLPGVGILRMDADTTGGKEGHRTILEKFGSGDYPVLVGTQMVAKGHHFPRVNLVGVLYAEGSLHYPDFRSSERTFQQLIQVAGRAGRTGDHGEVVVQTYTPDHHVFKYLMTHDYTGFMREELEIRRQLGYPPFSRIVLASFSARSKESLERVVGRWAQRARQLCTRMAGTSIDVLGPVPPPIERIKNRYRNQVMIKGALTVAIRRRLLESFEDTARRERGGRMVDLRWDVDPESFF